MSAGKLGLRIEFGKAGSICSHRSVRNSGALLRRFCHNCETVAVTAVAEGGVAVTAVAEGGVTVTAVAEKGVAVTAVAEKEVAVTAVAEGGVTVATVAEGGVAVTAVAEGGVTRYLPTPYLLRCRR